jgi:hypothetical protein
MRPSLIPCEVFETRLQAVQALAGKASWPVPERPLAAPPALVLEEVCGVTCVVYDYQAWTDNVGTMQSLLRSLVTEYGRTRIVVDFSGQVYVGTPAVACIYALWWALTEAGGRLGMCHLSQALLDFFHWHDRGRLIFPKQVEQERAEG